MKRTVRRYSEAFQRQVVSEIAAGKHSSIEAASRAYGITGARTVAGWVRKHGREDLLPTRTRVETMKERDEKQEMRRRMKDLERALTDAHLDFSLERAYLDMACEQLGVEVPAFKKKAGMTLSDVRRRGPVRCV